MNILPAKPKAGLLLKLLEIEVTSPSRILLVDDSRMMRNGLLKYLDGRYEVLEALDGEAAWQTLVLDESIKVVMSSLQVSKLNGFGLLERLRASRVSRLKAMPFIVLSEEECDSSRQKAKALGASGFLTKGAAAPEMLTCLEQFLALPSESAKLNKEQGELVQDPFTGLFTGKYLELQLAQALSLVARHQGEVSVIVLGFDGLPALRERLGFDLTEQVASRFAKMLSGKMRREDSLGHFSDGHYAIVSPGTSPALSASFAGRVREAVEASRVAVQGQPVTLTVSIGVASVPQDRVTSAGALLELASRRMTEAMQSGGNRIVTGGAENRASTPLTVQHALALLSANKQSEVKAQLPLLTLQLMPLLQLMNEELGLDLSLADLEKRLSDQVKQ